MYNSGFVQKITVVDEWESGGQNFRLVDLGAGPYQLQLMRDGSWVPESAHFVHCVLCERIVKLKTGKEFKKG
jgi:hypothetical protein